MEEKVRYSGFSMHLMNLQYPKESLFLRNNPLINLKKNKIDMSQQWARIESNYPPLLYQRSVLPLNYVPNSIHYITTRINLKGERYKIFTARQANCVCKKIFAPEPKFPTLLNPKPLLEFFPSQALSLV